MHEGPICKERFERYLRSPAWQVLTSAAYDQEALESLNGKGFGIRDDALDSMAPHATNLKQIREHSPFAQALFNALEGDIEADANKDGVLTASELAIYLRDQVAVSYTHLTLPTILRV